MMRFFIFSIISLIVATAFVLQGCDPVPRRTLSDEEKLADLAWIYSQFGQNYAPLEYKSQKFNLNYQELKQAYNEAALATKSNQDFFDLMFRFVSEFKDAHTAGTLTASDLPDRAKFSYLGFTGFRVGANLVVKELLPTTLPNSSYPIKPGDRILKIDGRDLPEVIKSDLVKFRDLGNDEANLTYHMNKIFNRLSIANGLPTASDAILTVQDAERIKTVTLPWVVKDLATYSKEQEEAKKAKDVLPLENDEKPFYLGFIGFDGKAFQPSSMASKISRTSPGFDVLNTFIFVDNIAQWTTNVVLNSDGQLVVAPEKPKTGLKQRIMPTEAVFLPNAVTFPAYVTRERLRTKAGAMTKDSKMIGYIRVDSFSYDFAMSKEFEDTILSMQVLGVNDIIIDLIDNGGGSLTLGMQMAQSLSAEDIQMSDIQMRLSDNWLDDFEQASIKSTSDAEKELYRRHLELFKQDQAAGKRLSRPINTRILSPFGIKANFKLEKKPNVVLLVNEMCASMCDIFSAILKDNNMATVIGTRTLGAGGNVVDHNQAPNSHFDVRQTESLLLRKDGSYIENNGVSPDIEVKVNEYAEVGYEPVRQRAIEFLTTLEN